MPNNKPPTKQGQQQRYSDEFLAAQWKPGQSGNPKGRAPRSEMPYADIVREMLAAKGVVLELHYLNKAGGTSKKRIDIKVNSRHRTLAHAIAITQLQKALKGDTASIEALINRSEGKPLERTRDETEVPNVIIELPNAPEPEEEEGADEQ